MPLLIKPNPRPGPRKPAHRLRPASSPGLIRGFARITKGELERHFWHFLRLAFRKSWILEICPRSGTNPIVLLTPPWWMDYVLAEAERLGSDAYRKDILEQAGLRDNPNHRVYDPARYLKSKAHRQAYLDEAWASGDPRIYETALSAVLRSERGMSAREGPSSMECYGSVHDPAP